MPKDRRLDTATDQHQVPSSAQRPGVRVLLTVAIWLAATLWALWHYSPGAQAFAASICRSTPP